MKRARAALAVCLVLSLCGCTPERGTGDGGLHILATTYPVYLFTTAIVGDTPGVEVERLIKEEVSCLHDYTLSVTDMKAIERADVIIISGAGLEEAMADALEQSGAPVIDCSSAVELLPALEHGEHQGHSHDHDEEQDPHIWMDPDRAIEMLGCILDGLCRVDGDHQSGYQANFALARNALEGIAPDGAVAGAGGELITFHNGFQYFACAYGLELLRAIEEEEGSTASAREIRELTALIEEREIPAIFVEKNGSRATAEVIARETGCKVLELDMLMSGEGVGIQPYLDAISGNLTTIWEAFA